MPVTLQAKCSLYRPLESIQLQPQGKWRRGGAVWGGGRTVTSRKVR